jgi:hypothetical protein
MMALLPEVHSILPQIEGLAKSNLNRFLCARFLMAAKKAHLRLCVSTSPLRRTRRAIHELPR